MSEDFDLFAVSAEHRMLRDSVRSLAAAKIAPRAAETDETATFPSEVYQALVDADLHAVHIPEAYGGPGADALANVIVIEEIARACAASALIPSVNKVATLPLMIAGSDELKKRYLPRVARDGAMFSYALSEAESGSDAAAMRTRAIRSGDEYMLTGTKRWITGAGIAQYYTVMAVTDPIRDSRGISAFVVDKDDPGVSFGPPERSWGSKAPQPVRFISTM